MAGTVKNVIKYKYNNPPHSTLQYPHTIVDSTNNRTYERMELLGYGGTSRCYKVRDVINNEFFACKMIEKKKLGVVCGLTRPRINEEIKIHQSLDHEHIVKFLSHHEDDDFIYIFVELCEHKDLVLLAGGKLLHETRVRYILRQLSSALHAMHADQRIVHRDIKRSNIFVGGNLDFKIGDFGSAIADDDDGELRRNFPHTVCYASPEIVLKKSHSFPADIWSLGVCVFQLLTGYPPFVESNPNLLKSKICSGQFSFPIGITVSLEMSNLIKRMLDLDPLKRPKAQEILDDPLFTNCHVPRALSFRSFRDQSPQDQDDINIVNVLHQ